MLLPQSGDIPHDGWRPDGPLGVIVAAASHRRNCLDYIWALPAVFGRPVEVGKAVLLLLQGLVQCFPHDR
eukprot:scaffold994_cov226-Prasinococcus_capsulatus_cf.AAC.5